MPALSASDVTVTVSRRDRPGKYVRTMGTIAFGDGSKTYPTGGVPLPSKSNFRLSSIINMVLTGESGSGYVYKYDYTNHKIRMYQTASVTPSGTNASESSHTHTENTAGTYTQNATTAAGSAHTHTFTGAATTPAALAELSTSNAPAAVTLYFEAIGKM